MASSATSVEEYLDGLPPERREILATVRDVVNAHLPEGYEECLEFGMIAWVVPLETFPDTYNGRPLGYVSLASQKNHVSLYLLGLYTDGPELAWFEGQYAERGLRLDMGRSCVRFKRLEEVPLDVLGQSVASIEVDELIARHEAARSR